MIASERFLRGYVVKHYERVWGSSGASVSFPEGAGKQFPKGFSVLEFAPRSGRAMWTYATCGMSFYGETSPIELHIFSPVKSDEPVELLVATAHYHLTGHPLGVGHTVNFGKPWIDSSECEYGLISLPYLDGPELENLYLPTGILIRCLWLIPITKSEVAFKKAMGLDALEDRFDRAKFNYLDPRRRSVC